MNLSLCNLLWIGILLMTVSCQHDHLEPPTQTLSTLSKTPKRTMEFPWQTGEWSGRIQGLSEPEVQVSRNLVKLSIKLAENASPLTCLLNGQSLPVTIWMHALLKRSIQSPDHYQAFASHMKLIHGRPSFMVTVIERANTDLMPSSPPLLLVGSQHPFGSSLCYQRSFAPLSNLENSLVYLFESLQGPESKAAEWRQVYRLTVDQQTVGFSQLQKIGSKVSYDTQMLKPKPGGLLTSQVVRQRFTTGPEGIVRKAVFETFQNMNLESHMTLKLIEPEIHRYTLSGHVKGASIHETTSSPKPFLDPVTVHQRVSQNFAGQNGQALELSQYLLDANPKAFTQVHYQKGMESGQVNLRIGHFVGLITLTKNIHTLQSQFRIGGSVVRSIPLRDTPGLGH